MVNSGWVAWPSTSSRRSAPWRTATSANFSPISSGSNSTPTLAATTRGFPPRTSNRASLGSRPTVRITGSRASSSSSPSTLGSSSPSSASIESPSPNSRGGATTSWPPSTSVTGADIAGLANSSIARLTASSEISGCRASVGIFCEPPCRNRRSRMAWAAPRSTTTPSLLATGTARPSRKVIVPSTGCVSIPASSSSRTACILDWSTVISA